MKYYANGRYYCSEIEAIEAITDNHNKIATWGAPLQINTRKLAYVGSGGPPGMPDAPIGALYFDNLTNKMWILNSKREWIYIANYGEYKDIKKHHNCRNCGAPVFGCKCDYCGTVY